MKTAAIHCRRSRHRSRRRGLTLIEILVTGILLGAAFTAMVPLLGWLVTERRAADHEQWALQEVSNVLERVSIAAGELTPEAIARIELSPSAKARLPGAELKVSVAPAEADLPLRRVTAELRWKTRSGVPAQVRLTNWMSPGEAKP